MPWRCGVSALDAIAAAATGSSGAKVDEVASDMACGSN
jgi:hypothetical protein